MLRALHVFPTFGADLVYGAERHEYLLSKKLVELGVAVDVLTTLTASYRQTSALSNAWPRDYRQAAEVTDGMRIERFASFSLPPRIGHALSRLMLKRWRREELRYGLMAAGSLNLVDYYYRRARERPWYYDSMMLLARGPYAPGLVRRLLRIGRDYDVLLVGFIPFALNWQVICAARVLRKPVALLALFHPEDLYHHFRAIYWCLNSAGAILAQTPFSESLFRRMFPKSRPVSAGVGVDPGEFDRSARCGARFRQRYGIRAGKIVLFVGRKEYFKRYDLAIDALNLLADERVGLVMIGRDVDGIAVDSPYATFLGELPRQDLLDAYDACDLLIVPSQSESFGWVVLEAWACRKPVIGNRLCAPVRSVIDDGVNGFVCSGAAEMACRIAQLTADPELTRRLGQAGFEKVAHRYTWDIIGRNVRDLYAQLANFQAERGPHPGAFPF